VHADEKREDAREHDEEILRGNYRRGVGRGAAERPGGRAARRIARDAAGVERQLAPPQLLLLQKTEAGADPAAHAGAMQSGGEPAERQRERQREIVHITFE
jgi:hypothetical protein